MNCEIVEIGNIPAAQFAPLLEAESGVWLGELRWNFTASAQVISNCLEERRLSGCAVVVEGRVRGYCFFFCDGEKGLIGDLFVGPLAPSFDHARRLAECVVDQLTATPGIHRIEAQLPHFSFEALDPAFRARCFEGYQRRFMAARLTGRFGPPARQPSGQSRLEDFQLVPWERRFDPEAAQLLFTTYRHHIDTTLNDQYASPAGTARLIENIVFQHGCGDYLPGASRVAIHRSSRKLAGVLALTAVAERTAHIPQVAVSGQFQGNGLGTALLESSLSEAARQGFTEVSLTVTDLNEGALRLYERLGFETFRTFGAFVWNRP